MWGRRSGFFNQESEGALTTPFGNVSFTGTRPFMSGGEHVSLVYGDGHASARLVFPRTWGIFSCSNRARLWTSSDAGRPFEVWRPSIRSQETIGRFRPHEGKAVVYRLFSRTDGDTMFQDGAAFSQMQDGDALVMLASLLYMCIDPGLILDVD